MDVSLLIRLIDQVSGPAKRVGQSLQTIGDYARELGGGFADAVRQGFSAENIEEATRNAETQLAEARSRLLGALGMAMTLAAPMMKAGQFDQSIRGLEKVLDASETRLAQLRRFALETSTLIPVAARELVELMSEAAQGGVPQEELEAFSLYVARAAVAFDMAGGEIGERFAKLRNVYRLNQQGIEELGDATNHLSNNMAAKANELTDFVNRASGAAEIFRLTATQTTAVGAAMIASGIVPESAARGFTTLATRIMAGGDDIEAAFAAIGMDRGDFMQMLETDAPAALETLFRAMSQSPDGMQALLDLAGLEFTDDMAKLIGNPDILAQAFTLVADASAYAGSATEEAAKQAAGAQRQWDLLRNRLERMAIVLGDRLLPLALSLADRIGAVIDRVAEFTDANPELARTLVIAVAGMMAFSIAARLLAFAVAGLRLPLIGLLRTFLLFRDGRNVALGWRLMAGAGRLLGGAARFLGGSAALAYRSLGDLIRRVGGLRNALRGGVAAGWVIPLAFEFLDDMGRTPEERLEQIRRRQEAFQQLSDRVDESAFGRWWQSVKDGANNLLGLDQGEVPAEALARWLGQGWDSFDQAWTERSAQVRASAAELGSQLLAGLQSRWSGVEAWVDQQIAWLGNVWSGLDLSSSLSASMAGMVDGLNAAWAGVEAWVNSKVEWLRSAFDFDFTSWFGGGGGQADQTAGRSAALAKASAAGAPGAQLGNLAKNAASELARGGDAVARGGEEGGRAVAHGGSEAGNALQQGATALREAASAVRAAIVNASRAATGGGTVNQALATSRTSALHGGTE